MKKLKILEENRILPIAEEMDMDSEHRWSNLPWVNDKMMMIFIIQLY